MCRTACTEPQCLYSRAKPLLPLCAVRPVQSLSVCTVDLYLYSPYVPYGLYRASVPVQYIYTSTPPMGRTACTVSVPVQYSYTSTPPMGRTTCTVSVPVQYSYTSTPPMGRTTCTVSVPVQYSYTSTPPMGRTACTVSVPVQGCTLPLSYTYTFQTSSFPFYVSHHSKSTFSMHKSFVANLIT